MQLGVLGLVIVLFLESATPLEQTKKEQYKEHTGSASVVQVQINPNIHHTQEEKATFSPEQYFQRKDDVAAKQYHQVETENQGNIKETSESASRPQSTVSLDTEKGSRPGQVVSFNLTEAVQIGIRFQDLFCPKFCDGNGNVKSQECSRTTPSCPTCLCEADCGRYGYCCSHLQPSSGLTPSYKEEIKNETNVSFEEDAGCEHKLDMNGFRSQNTEGHAVVSNVSNCMEAEKSYFRCFAIEKWKTIYLVAKCPSIKQSSDEFHNNNTVIPIKRNGHAANKSIIELCDSCISNVDLVSLVTSHLTGDTYCNKYCLQCHENRSLGINDLTWQQEETCRAVPAATLHGMEVTTESLKSCLEENGHQNQNDSRNCSNGQSQLMSKEKIFENQTIEPEGNFATQENTKAADTLKKSKHKIRLDTQCSVKYVAPPSVHLQACDYRLKDAAVETCNLTATRQVFQDAANETLQDLERLCVDHWAPVYDKTKVYRNIFCFICQGQKPTKCGEFRQNYKPETKSMFKEITIALLTDLSGRVESRGSSGQDQDNSTFSCKDGFWENPITVRHS
ncbi:hypothetical protein EGW08_020940 [Elysia chlorotica]|uniref:SMB domain-containing protein n=1 Tax=Elysia chlorotica TaxID=188477 RepID=A0A3S1AZN0_ELYCH|nr:hypothetical protein EGW08_020940 [Elysia chlorotica]